MKKVHKAQTAQKVDSKTQKIEPQQKYCHGSISNTKLLGGLNRFYIAFIILYRLHAQNILRGKSLVSNFDQSNYYYAQSRV